MKRQLILEDGSIFIGEAFGGNEYRLGEIVFNTGMSGYQEVLSDLSYCGQIVMMTYPMVGNYGINQDDFESINPTVYGFVVGEHCEYPSNFRSKMTLDEFLKQKDIPGLAGIDTRALTKKLRQIGTMKAIMADMDVDVKRIVKGLQDAPYPSGQVQSVSTQKPYLIPNHGKKVALIDFGAKQGIMRELREHGCDLVILPYNVSAKDVLALNPDGVMLSNGPGNPKDVEEAIETIKQLLGKVPIFGICLGHQLLALACGANTIKLKFGHRGCNHPVTNLESGQVDITSQNHSFTIEEKSLAGTGLIVTHRALNDKSVEGVKHTTYPAFSVQYHPEASPGPEDTNYLFKQFVELMNNEGGKN